MRTKRRLLLAGIVVSSLMMMAPIIGSILMNLLMLGAFSQLHRQGVSDPRALASGVGSGVTVMLVGWAVAFLGLALFIPSLILFLRLPAEPPALPGAAAKRID